MEAALKIDGSNDNQPRGLNAETASLIRDIVFSDMELEEKDKALETVEKCSATIIQDCHFETKEVRKMSLWEMIHYNYLGGKHVSRWQ